MNQPQAESKVAEREVFLDALERPAGAEREAFLAAACSGRPGLR